LGDEERVAELHSTLLPYIKRRQKISVEKVAPEDDLQRFAGWNDFFATAGLSVVDDEELCKTLTQARAGRVWVRKQHYKTLLWS
jgi:hypothetical protein